MNLQRKSTKSGVKISYAALLKYVIFLPLFLFSAALNGMMKGLYSCILQAYKDINHEDYID